MSRSVESQRDQFPHRVAAYRTAMPAPTPELTFRHHPPGEPHKPAYSKNTIISQNPAATAYVGNNPAAYLTWLLSGEISYIHVKPEYQRHGIATALFDWTKNNLSSDLHHSDVLSSSAQKWVNYEQSRTPTRTAADWSQPRHLNTPTYSAEDRRQFYHPTEFTDRHQFSPTEFNPHADSPARPRLRWSPASPEQDTLDLDVPSHFSYRPGETPESIQQLVDMPWRNPEKRGTSPDGVYPVDRKPQKLYRGVNLDLRHPEMQEVHRALWGPEYAYPTNFAEGTENPGLFPRPLHTPDPRGFDNTDLGQKILDHVSTWHPDVGMGRHWTTDRSQAEMFAGASYSTVQPALISAEWLGRGEDPYRTDAYGNYDTEKEITMMPGAPLRVTQVHLRHPDTGKWHPVLGTGPQHREAALEDDEDDEDDEGTFCASCGPDDPDWCEECETCASCNPDHQNHCSECGPNDSDWCKDCEECKSCDAHTEHCEKCGPNDPDWCESCDTCASCDSDHENHCPSCGPNDSDWCENCEECSYCGFHDNHCPSCGPNDSDWCENCEECQYCGGCECGGVVNPQPLSLTTPLYGPKDRPRTNDHDSDGNRQYLFLPHEINPASDAESRPYVHFPLTADAEYPELIPGLKMSNGVDTIPASTSGAEMHRGVTIDLKKPELASLRRAIFGPQFESYYVGTPQAVNIPGRPWETKQPIQPGMFGGIFSDKELTGPPADPDRLHRYLHTVLGHMSNWSPRRGLGEHWSTDQYQADSFAGKGGFFNRDNLKLPVRMTARWRGQGEDPYRPNTGEDHQGQFEEESEISLLPHAPLTLENLEIYHPKTRQWHSLMDLPDPIRVYAVRDR